MPIIKRINSTDTTTLTLSEELTVIGRAESCDVRVTGHTEVSREHCGIRHYEDGSTTVVDLGSKNGTFVNDHKIGKETTLQDGDVVRLTKRVEFLYKLQEDTSQIEETMIAQPEEVTMAEKVELGKAKSPVNDGKELSEAVNEVEKELENAGFKTLMAKFSKQAKHKPRKPKESPDKRKDDDNAW